MKAKLNQRVIILGAAGFIGFHLSKALANIYSCNLVLVDNFIRGENDNPFKILTKLENVTFLNLDLTHQLSFANLFHENDIVVNCAAFNGTQNFYSLPTDVIRNSAIPSILAPECAAKSKVAKYIYLGSAESYAGSINLGLATLPTPENVPLVIEDPSNIRWSYAASKTIGEVAAIANQHSFGLDIKILRVHNIYGPRMGINHVVPDLVEKFSNGCFDVFGVDESRAFMYVDDLITILLNFIFDTEFDENLIYHIGSSHETTIHDLALLILRCLKIDGVVNPVGNLKGSVQRRIPDTTLLKARMDFSETSLIDGINKYINWYKKVQNN